MSFFGQNNNNNNNQQQQPNGFGGFGSTSNTGTGMLPLAFYTFNSWNSVCLC
jgi:hypothetical protein